MANAQDYSWSKYTPLDNTGTNRSVFQSAYKNIRFALRATEIEVLRASDVANLPGISFRLYGDVSLWRVLMHYNGIVDPLTEVYAGMTLRIPAKADIISYLSQQQNNKTTTLVV